MKRVLRGFGAFGYTYYLGVAKEAVKRLVAANLGSTLLTVATLGLVFMYAVTDIAVLLLPAFMAFMTAYHLFFGKLRDTAPAETEEE